MKKILFIFLFLYCINNTEKSVMALEENHTVLLPQKVQVQYKEEKIPVRAFFEEMGYSVEWNAEKQQIIIKNGDSVINIDVLEKQAIVKEGKQERIFSNLLLQNKNGSWIFSLQEISDLLQCTVIVDQSKESYIEIEKEYPDYTLLQNTEAKVTHPNEILHYNEQKKDMEEIYNFIKKNFDSYFQDTQFDIKFEKNIGGFDRLDIYYKLGDFVTEHGYSIILSHGDVMEILIYGNPSCQYIVKIPTSMITEKKVVDIAKKEIVLQQGERIEKYHVLKKYDTQPYYVVVFDIALGKEEHATMYRGAHYEYRIDL